VVVVVTVAALAAACGSSSATMPTTNVARAIQDTILRQNGVRTKVACPSRVKAQSGYRFTCLAALAVGAYPMYVVEQNAHGAVTYVNRAPLRVLDSYTIERAIEHAIGRQKHLKARAICPNPVLQTPALSFTCKATFKGGSTLFSVTETDASGDVKFVGR
jgi:hypothetical protein